MDDLQLLLSRKTANEENISKGEKKSEAGERPSRSDKGATLSTFIHMVSEVVHKALKKSSVSFLPDEGKRLTLDPQQKIDKPTILYKVVDRTPKLELKPRVREEGVVEVTDVEGEARRARIYGQKFKCIVQFDIVASEYSQADKVMNTFEELIASYTHYFKRNGVGELYFNRHFTDESLDVYRETLSVRSLQYYVEVEKTFPIFDSEYEGLIIH